MNSSDKSRAFWLSSQGITSTRAGLILEFRNNSSMKLSLPLVWSFIVNSQQFQRTASSLNEIFIYEYEVSFFATYHWTVACVSNISCVWSYCLLNKWRKVSWPPFKSPLKLIVRKGQNEIRSNSQKVIKYKSYAISRLLVSNI